MERWGLYTNRFEFSLTDLKSAIQKIIQKIKAVQVRLQYLIEKGDFIRSSDFNAQFRDLEEEMSNFKNVVHKMS